MFLIVQTRPQNWNLKVFFHYNKSPIIIFSKWTGNNHSNGCLDSQLDLFRVCHKNSHVALYEIIKIQYIITQQRNTTRRICLFVAWSYKTCGSIVQPLVGSLMPMFSPKIQLTRDKMRSSFWGCNCSYDPPSPLGGKSSLLWGKLSLLSAQLCWPSIVTLWYLPTRKTTQQFIPFNPPCKK